MEYDNELIKIVKDKKFKSFWVCLEYFLNAGYNYVDALGISLSEFGESTIFSDVAFLRGGNVIVNKPVSTHDDYGTFRGAMMDPLTGQIRTDKVSVSVLKIGLVDETNIHLVGLYETYMKSILNGKMDISEDIESTCKVVELHGVSMFMRDYLLEVANKHYGFEIKSFEPKNENDERDQRAMMDGYNRG